MTNKLATDYATYKEYCDACRKLEVQVIPERLFYSLKELNGGV